MILPSVSLFQSVECFFHGFPLFSSDNTDVHPLDLRIPSILDSSFECGVFHPHVEEAKGWHSPAKKRRAWYFLIIDKVRTGDLIHRLASQRLSRYSIATAGPFHSLSSSQLGESELPSQSPGKKGCYYSLPTSVTPYSCKRRFVHFLAST